MEQNETGDGSLFPKLGTENRPLFPKRACHDSDRLLHYIIRWDFLYFHRRLPNMLHLDQDRRSPQQRL